MFEDKNKPRVSLGLTGVPAQSASSLSGPVGLLVTALDALSAQEPAQIPGSLALLEAQVLLVQQDRLRALTLARVADVETRQLHDLVGAPSTPAWVADQHTSMTRADVTLARRLDRVPQIAAWIASGTLSVEGGARIERVISRLRPHVDRPDGMIDGQPGEQVLRAVIVDGVRLVVAEALGGLPDDDLRLVRLDKELRALATQPVSQLTRLEAAFLLLASQVEPAQLRPGLVLLTDALLPNQLAERADDAHLQRRLELVRHDDGSGWTVRGHLDLECGELLHTALSAAMTEDPANPEDTATAAALRADGIEPFADSSLDGCYRVRSLPQRRHDALKLLLARLLETGALGQRGKIVPQIAVTVSLGALHDQPGALPGRGASGAALPAGLIRGWLCDSALTRFVLSAGHRVLETSHTVRTLKPHERRIKQLETGGRCQAVGCQRGIPSGHRLVPHHVQAYARSGITSLTDTVLLCEVSHRDLHEGNKTIRLKDGRRICADGWVTANAAVPGHC